MPNIMIYTAPDMLTVPASYNGPLTDWKTVQTTVIVDVRPMGPSPSPTRTPTMTPTSSPTMTPTMSPTSTPTEAPTWPPGEPTLTPTAEPTASPTQVPGPTGSPTIPPLIKDDHFQYMHGYPEGYFAPAGPMTRAEAAVMFARLSVENMKVSYPYKATFSDVKPSDWFCQEVEFLASYGVISGYPQKGGGQYFDPSAPITRAEFAKIAYNYDTLKLSNSGNSKTFPDVPASHWAYPYISSIAAREWVQGDDWGLFHPNNNIRRVDVVTIVNRMLEREFDPYFEPAPGDPGLLNYTDVSKTFWGYADIMEASNSHYHDYYENGREKWKKIRRP